MSTWKPWKPVAKKNTEPKTLSVILNEDDKYSIIWNKVNKQAKNNVSTKAHKDSTLLPQVIAWCEYVIVTPEQSKSKVFKRGIALGSKVTSPLGGQILPISIDGERLAEKKAQKKAKKNIISDIMNKIIP